MHDCEHFVEKNATNAAAAQERDPLSELEVITTLYFPELKSEVDGYLDRCRARQTEALTNTESVTSKLVLEEFKSARDKLSAAAQSCCHPRIVIPADCCARWVNLSSASGSPI